MVFRCCVSGCGNSNKEAKMHAFPYDMQEFKVWCEAIHRHEFLNRDISTVRKNYRVCEDHFDENCLFITNRNRTNLKCGSIPSKNVPAAPFAEHAAAIPLEQALSDPVPSIPKQRRTQARATLYKDVMNRTVSKHKKSSTSGPKTPQTLAKLEPQKELLRGRICKLLDQTKPLKIRKIDVQETSESCATVQNCTLEQFKHSCDRFLPKECSAFVKMQAELHNNQQQRQFSSEFLEVCLRLSHAGPRAYGILRELFLLPSQRTLNTLTENVPVEADLLF